MYRSRAFFLPLLLLLAVGFAIFLRPSRETPATRIQPHPEKGFINTEIFSDTDLTKWTDPQRTIKSPTSNELPRLLELAKERSATMKKLIAADPEQALRVAITPARYEALPEELKPWFERPFAQAATLRVMPICAPGANHGPDRHLEMEGKTWFAYVHGWRKGQTSKEDAPMVGITLDDLAAISDRFFQIVPSDEEAHVAALPMGNGHPEKDFATGEPVGSNPVLAVMAGKQYRFSSTTSLEDTNQQLANLERFPAPRAGANVILAAPARKSGGSIDWAAAKDEVMIQASLWTESTKKVFAIRVDFTNRSGAPSSKAELESLLNGPVASSLHEMSYGKTTITATASESVIRMPHPSGNYAPAKNNELHADAITAYKTANGPSSLNDYDIVVVHFTDIDMQGGGFSYAGLADLGGSRQWLQGELEAGVTIHEFGHNYGIDHSSFWQTSNGTVVGNGTSVEYGDHTDIMGSGPDPEGHFHMQAKQFLNWFPDGTSSWEDATTAGSGTRRIHRFDSASTTGTVRGVRVRKAASPAEYYWVGYRPGISSLPAFQNGAYLLWQRANENRSWLIDTTPNSGQGKDDSALSIGRTYSDSLAGIHITPTAKGGSGADQWMDVNIQLGSFPGNSAPTATFTGTTTVVTRTPATFSVVASDADLDSLVYFWDFGDGGLSQNSPTITHQWNKSGTYTVSVTVSDMKGGIVTRSQAITVTDPLDTWNSRGSGTTADLEDIASGGGVLVAVGYEASNFKGIYTRSSDGASWTKGEIRDNTIPTAIIHDGSRFISVGLEYDFSVPAGWKGAIFTSPDGTSWTRRHFGGPGLRGIAASGNAYVAVGDNGAVMFSTDAVTWVPVSSGTTMTIWDVAWGGGRFVAGAGNVFSEPYGRATITSPDGQTWTNHGTAGLPYLSEISEIEYIDGRFIAGGWNAGIRESTNLGITFTATENSSRVIRGIASGNGTYLAVGNEPGMGGADLNMVSADGKAWTAISTNPQNDRNDLIFFKNTFITVGDGGSILQSGTVSPALSAFETWALTHFPSSPPLSGPNDDYDGDGVKNLVEYATGTDPKSAASRATITTVKQGATLVLSIPRDPTATGVTISGTTSSTLSTGGWSTSGVTVLEDSANQYRASIPVGSGNGFLRAEFSTP
jgi:PKD repeat protein